MRLRRKKKLKVDLRELKDERESLSTFLRSKLKVDVTSSGNKVLLDSEILSSKELKRMVNKFFYHRSLMTKYWVGRESGAIKINKFKRSEKKKEKRGSGLARAWNPIFSYAMGIESYVLPFAARELRALMIYHTTCWKRRIGTQCEISDSDAIFSRRCSHRRLYRILRRLC